MGRVQGKVAFVTGAARGQGRSHALRLAEEGADIIAIDLCEQVETVPYPMSTPSDLAETVAQVEALDRRIVSRQADVRNVDQLREGFAAGLAEFGHVDIVAINHGITSIAPAMDITSEMWRDMIDINLTGVWNVCQTVIPSLIEQKSGVIIITSSVAGLKGYGNLAHYVAAKHGVVGLMRALANELGPHGVRVHSLHPSQVDTPMLMNQAIFDIVRPDIERPTADDFLVGSGAMHLLPVQVLEPRDVSNVVLFLASDEARYLTGIPMPVDGGSLAKAS